MAGAAEQIVAGMRAVDVDPYAFEELHFRNRRLRASVR